MKKILFLVFSCFCIADAKDLIASKSLIEGELKNGFKYTIKKNEKPENMASFRLLVRVGSLEEDEDQSGIAHLVEHLAFNGTGHFEKNSLIDFLESLGVDFGSHLNASTGFDKTIYQLQIPLKGDNLEKTMLIFSDWAGDIRMNKSELDKERGVVLEEERVRNNVNYRIYKQLHEVAYDKSRFKDRMPIGKRDIIENISLKRVEDFYKTWYQPRFMHFVAVGDFDEKKIEKLIEKNFSHLKNTNKKKLYKRNALDPKTMQFKIFRDKELTSMGVNFSLISPYRVVKTQEDYKKDFLIKFIAKLFNLKARELEQTKNPFAKNVRFSTNLFGDNLYYHTFRANFLEKNAIKAYKQMLNLIYSVDKNGFDKRDFEIVKADIRAKNDYELKNIKNKTSNSYASEISYYKAYDEIYLDKKYAVDLENKILDALSLKEVNLCFRNILKSKSSLVYFVLPNDYEISLDEIKQVHKKRKNAIKKEKKKKILPNSIEVKNLKEGKIISQKYDKKYDFYEFILENGVRVVYKYNDYEKNKIKFKAFSKGGYSLYDTKFLVDARASSKVISNSGFGEYNFLEVEKIYADKIVNLKPYIERYFEGFSGSSSNKDFEELLKGVYLFAKQYKIDDNVLFNLKQQMLEGLEKEKNSPQISFSNEFNKFYFNNNKRYIKEDKNDVKNISKKEILKIYGDRFSDFSDFTFFIIGDVKKQRVEKYIKLYLANLNSTKRNENYKNRGLAHIKGSHTFIKNLNNQNMSTIFLSYKKQIPYSLEEWVKLKALQDVLSEKLREYIREEKSGAYGVAVRAYFERLPKDEAVIKIHFACDPKRKEELSKYVKEVIREIQTKELDKKYINAFIKKENTKLDEISKNNSFWESELMNFYMYGNKIKSPKEYKQLYKLITPKILQESAKKYFDTKDIIYAQLNPKKENKNENKREK
ncbi:MAG: hypothetical protein CR967_02865 [Proteobacteria bacterium]|nr:MAG: hypothetical protein CR967_02865 [Pseudomonadota bacterium]